MQIAILYNDPLPSRYDILGEDCAVSSVKVAVSAVNNVLALLGHRVSLVGLKPPISCAVATLSALDVDMFFNLFEGFDGRPETEWQFAQVLEGSGVPFTGAPSRTLALCLNKGETKQVLLDSNLPTAPFQLLESSSVSDFNLSFPVIVKPLMEDASHGLSSDSVVYDMQNLTLQVRNIENNYGGPVLIEGFLPGREFNASVLGGSVPRMLPPTEIAYTVDMPGKWILTFASKWMPQNLAYRASEAVCPAQISNETYSEIERLVVGAYKSVGSPPYARVDMRADGQGRLHILEVNPNPDLDPDVGMSLQARAGVMSYEQLIEVIVGMALEGTKFGGRSVTTHATR